MAFWYSTLVLASLNGLLAFVGHRLVADLRELHQRFRDDPPVPHDALDSGGFVSFVFSNADDEARPVRRRVLRCASFLVLLVPLSLVAFVRLAAEI